MQIEFVRVLMEISARRRMHFLNNILLKTWGYIPRVSRGRRPWIFHVRRTRRRSLLFVLVDEFDGIDKVDGGDEVDG